MFPGADESIRTEINRKLKEKNIAVHLNGKVKEIFADHILL
jgi:hypothetical protein